MQQYERSLEKAAMMMRGKHSIVEVKLARLPVLVELLLATRQVDVDSKDWYLDQTPLSWAARIGHEHVVKLLLAKGHADFKSRDRYSGLTPWSWAAKNGCAGVMKLLDPFYPK
jgi:ankyrin repeat protein